MSEKKKENEQSQEKSLEDILYERIRKRLLSDSRGGRNTINARGIEHLPHFLKNPKFYA